jgi:hypothetical protein
MALCPVPIIETGGVVTAAAVAATATSIMGLDRYPIPYLKLIHGFPHRHHHTRVFMARDKLTVRGLT